MQYQLLLWFQPVWYFWEYDVINSIFQTKTGTREINGGRKFSEIKVQKTWVLMFVIDWNLARSFEKTYCARKCKKNWISTIWSQCIWSLNQQLAEYNLQLLSGFFYMFFSLILPFPLYMFIISFLANKQTLLLEALGATQTRVYINLSM